MPFLTLLMLSHNINVSFNPSQSHLNLIKEWLKEEYQRFKRGFYCNWSSIESSYNEKCLAVIYFDDEPIGFNAFFEWNLTATFNVVEIKQSWRDRGIGKILVDHCLDHLKSKGFSSVDLQCKPASSEVIWKRLGFDEYPSKLQRPYSTKRLFKILTPSIKLTKLGEAERMIELWDGEPHETKNKPATWRWELEFEGITSKLSLPIIQPAYHNWRIRLTVRSEVLIDTTVKYFNREDVIDCRDFIVIKALP